MVVNLCGSTPSFCRTQLQVELSFKTGDVVLVYGEMDEDGFYMGELDGVRGLVPSNFLAEAPEQYNNQMAAGGMGRGGMNNRGGRTSAPGGSGPGARGPPPPPRDNMNMGPVGVNQRGQQMRKGMSSIWQLPH